MKRMLVILFSLMLIFSVGSAVVSAQTRDDTDGDGIPNSADNCPNQPGPRTNGGCPLPDTGGNGGGSQDRDGDGVADFVDRCPDQPGTGFTQGCPADQPQPTTNAPLPPASTFSLPPLPETGECMLATRSAQHVNIRAAASMQSPIVGTLNPSLTYPVIAQFVQADGNWLRIAAGWVAEWVVREGGNCDILAHIQFSALFFNSNPGPPDSPLTIIRSNPETPETLLATFSNHSKSVELSRFLSESPEINPNGNGDCDPASGGTFAYGGSTSGSNPCDQTGDCDPAAGGTFAYGGSTSGSNQCDQTGDCDPAAGGTFAYGGSTSGSNPCDQTGDCDPAAGGTFAYGGSTSGSNPCDQTGDCDPAAGGTFAYGGSTSGSNPCDQTGDCDPAAGGTFAYGGSTSGSNPCDQTPPQSGDCGNEHSMHWSSGGASIQMSYGGTSIGGSVMNETYPCVRSAPDGRGVVIKSGDLSFLLHFYAGMDTTVIPNELFVLGVIEPSDGTGAIYPEFHALVDPNIPTTIQFDFSADSSAQALFLTWWSSAVSQETPVQSNPGPPDNPAEASPGPATIQGMFLKPAGDGAAQGVILGALWNGQDGGGVNEIALADTAGGQNLLFQWFLNQSLAQ